MIQPRGLRILMTGSSNTLLEFGNLLNFLAPEEYESRPKKMDQSGKQKYWKSGWWFGTFFPHILGIIIPINIYHRGWNHQPEICCKKKHHSNPYKEMAIIGRWGKQFQAICMVGGVIWSACNPIGDDEPNGCFRVGQNHYIILNTYGSRP